MVKKKCKCKKRGRPRKPGPRKGSKNKKRTKRRQKGGAIPALALSGAKFLAPIALEYLLKRMKKGNGLRLLHQR